MSGGALPEMALYRHSGTELVEPTVRNAYKEEDLYSARSVVNLLRTSTLRCYKVRCFVLSSDHCSVCPLKL